MGCIICHNPQDDEILEQSEQPEVIINPLSSRDPVDPPVLADSPVDTTPKPGDIVKLFEQEKYNEAIELYEQHLPTTKTFSDEDIACVVAIFTAQCKLKKCAEPAWTLTKTRGNTENESKARVYARLISMTV